MFNLINNKKGITLIALIITIVILIILSAVSLNAIIGNDLLDIATNGSGNYVEESIKEGEKLEDARSFAESAADNIRNILGENEGTLGTAGNPYNYLDLIGTAVQINYTITVNDLTLQVGDYVAYTPSGTTYLKTDMDNYSGNTDNNDLTPENLQWRVFDVKDGKIRLISWNGTSVGTSNTSNGKIKLGYGTEDEGNNEARWDRKCYGI